MKWTNQIVIGIYPNPFSDYFILECDTLTDENETLKIFDALGVLVYNETGINANHKKWINSSHMIPGMYYLKLYNSSGLEIYSTKLIKL